MMRGDALREYAESGSAESFRRLVEGHIDAVFSQCRRQLRDADRAQEATQMVFVILAKKARGLPEGVMLGGWLFKTARYVCARERRTEGRRLARERRAAEMRREMTGGDSMGTHDVKEEAEGLLDDAIAKLSERDRAVILCRFFEERSLREVGEAMGISEDAAKQRVLRAVEKLRVYFARQGLAVPSAVVTASLSGAVGPATPGLLDAVISAATSGVGVGHAGFWKSVTGGTMVKGAAAIVAVAGMVGASVIAAKSSPAANPGASAAAANVVPMAREAATGPSVAAGAGADVLDQSTPINALRALAQAIRENNVEEIESCAIFKEAANPELGKALHVTVLANAAVCRLDQAWMLAFGQHMQIEGFGFNIFPGIGGGFEELIDRTTSNVRPGDVVIEGTKATVRVQGPQADMARYGQGSWPGALLIMQLQGDRWILNAPATVTLDINIQPKQLDALYTYSESNTELRAIMLKAADAIESSKLKSPKEASDQVNKEFRGVLNRLQVTNMIIGALPQVPGK